MAKENYVIIVYVNLIYNFWPRSFEWFYMFLDLHKFILFIAGVKHV